jgi:hypothetical protein
LGYLKLLLALCPPQVSIWFGLDGLREITTGRERTSWSHFETSNRPFDVQNGSPAVRETGSIEHRSAAESSKLVGKSIESVGLYFQTHIGNIKSIARSLESMPFWHTVAIPSAAM